MVSMSPTAALAQSAPQAPREWWNAPYPRPADNPSKGKLPKIRVEGNHFVEPDGNPVLFRGLSISDPDKLEKQGHWNREYFEKVKEMGAALVRIPVHPIAWRGRTPAKYLELLDQAVQWCTELRMHVIIDWHSIGNLQMELFQHPMYDTTRKETYQFWQIIARHFAGHNTVAFYELFNEPTRFRGQLGSVNWSEWKKTNEDIIRLIRSFDEETIPLVAGFDWAYDLTPLKLDPVDAAGIGYVTHPYPNKRRPPWPPKWDEDFGFAAAAYPVVATEMGFGLRPGETIDGDHYGPVIVKYLEERGISWLGWVFDAEWHPNMIRSWDDYSLTGSGEFFKKALHGQAGQ